MGSQWELLHGINLENRRFIKEPFGTYSSLIRKKEMLLEEDKELAYKFEEYEKVIDELNSTRDKLKKEIEDLEWETCFQESL